MQRRAQMRTLGCMSTHPDFSHEKTHLGQTVDCMISRADHLSFVPDNGDVNDERIAGLASIGADHHTSLVIRMDNAEEAERINDHLREPYFGRMDVQAGGKTKVLYLGMHAFYDPKGAYTVTDWRSPIGQLFSGTATVHGKAEVLLKRKLDIKNRELLQVTDLYGDRVENADDAREAALLERLEARSEGRMSHVVPTIQPEQDLLIRAPLPGVRLVQGPAGSGKTSIAFHRVSFLAFGEEPVAPEDTLVLVPNDVMLNYATEVTHELGVPGVRLSTPHRTLARLANFSEQVRVTDTTLDMMLGRTSDITKRGAWLRAKALGEAAMFDLARMHVIHVIEETLLSLKPSDPQVVLRATQAARESAALNVPESVIAHLSASLRAEGVEDAEDVATRAVRRAPLGSPKMLQRSLMTEEALTRANLQAGSPLHESKLRHAVTDAPQHLTRMVGAHVDHVTLPLVAALTLLLGHVPTLPAVRHLVIDEAHDIAPLAYRVLREALRPEGVTALGDINQSIHGYRGLTAWEQAASALGAPDAPLEMLSRSYRSTAQITAVAQKVAATYTRNQALLGEAVNRAGPAPRWYDGDVTASVTEAVRGALERGQRSVAVLLRNNPNACDALARALRDVGIAAQAITLTTQRYQGGVAVMTVDRAKGLEFDACVVADATAQAYPEATEYERRLLYVAVTRGMHELHLVCGDEAPHPLLDLALAG